MPLYDFECEECGQFEQIFSVKDVPHETNCPDCGRPSKKIIVLGHGGSITDESAWVRSVSKQFEIDGQRPMNTKSELRDFYIRNKGKIAPKEGHPAFPSWLGDVKRPPTEKERKQKLVKEGREYLRKRKAITLQTPA